MAWGDLLGNQMVSYADATGSGFALQPGQTNPGTLQCMTKNDALNKYVINSAAMASYANNQLVPKSTWKPVATTYNFGPDVATGAGWPSGGDAACALSNSGYTVYSPTAVLTAGMYLYSDEALTTPAFPNGVQFGNPYVHSGTSVMRLTVNNQYCVVSSQIGTCNAVYSYVFSSTSYTNSTDSCNGTNTGITLYSASSSLGVGTRLFQDSHLLSPLAINSNSYIKSGNVSYRVTDYGSIYADSGMEITQVVNCGSSCGPITVGYDVSSGINACANFNTGATSIVYSDPASLSTSTILYRTSCGGTPGRAGYYSNGVIVRYWNGVGFTTQSNCIQ
jgi:hypothetical protein